MLYEGSLSLNPYRQSASSDRKPVTPCPRPQCSFPSFQVPPGRPHLLTLLPSKPHLWARSWLHRGRRKQGMRRSRSRPPSPTLSPLLLLLLSLSIQLVLFDHSVPVMQGAHSEGQQGSRDSAERSSLGEGRWNEAAARGRTFPLIQPLN